MASVSLATKSAQQCQATCVPRCPARNVVGPSSFTSHPSSGAVRAPRLAQTSSNPATFLQNRQLDSASNHFVAPPALELSWLARHSRGTHVPIQVASSRLKGVAHG